MRGKIRIPIPTVPPVCSADVKTFVDDGTSIAEPSECGDPGVLTTYSPPDSHPVAW